VSLIVMGTACRKQVDVVQDQPVIVRNVRFGLYSNSNTPGDNTRISFTTAIRNKDKILWDSVLAPMQIKDIPDAAHMLIIEKSLLTKDTSLLKAGFYYTIDNVGSSWYVDSFAVYEGIKTINFNFQK
jgi:hypothetical protein